MPDPQLIQVNKYPNRRLYDQTRSRHLTHEELYELVVAGHTVRVSDSKTGQDITSLVLTQALIERSPEKFAAIPAELLHLMIRASESMLRGFAGTWFAQIMRGMGGVGGAGSVMPTPFPGFPFGFPAPSTPPPVQQPAAAPPPTDPMDDLRARMDAMMQELAALKAAKQQSKP